MITIASTGDWHLTEGPRFADTVGCLQFIAADGAEHGVSLWVVGGDLAGTTVPHRASPAERNTLADVFRRMADHAPLVILYGNHDYGVSPEDGDLEIYGKLAARHPIRVVRRPEVFEVGGVRLYALPYPSKRWAVGGGAVGGGLEEQKQGMEGGLRGILTAWGLDAADARNRGIPTVGAAHINIGGSRVGGGEVMIGREVELSPHDLTELGLDVGLLSHIHLEQEMAPGWRYHGTPARQNFGEEGYDCSYNLVQVASGQLPVFTRRMTPARRLVTVDVRWDGERWERRGDVDLEGADVRVRVEMREDHVDTFPEEEIGRAMAGAMAVRIERRIVPKVRIRSEAIRTAVTVEEKLQAYWDSLGTAGPSPEARTRALDRYAEMKAAPAMASSAASEAA